MIWAFFFICCCRAPVQPISHILTEQQNHRIVGVGRDLCGSSSPPLLPKQGRLQQAAQDLVQAGLEYLQRRRLHNLPGQPGPGLRHPQREEVLPHGHPALLAHTPRGEKQPDLGRAVCGVGCDQSPGRSALLAAVSWGAIKSLSFEPLVF